MNRQSDITDSWKELHLQLSSAVSSTVFGIDHLHRPSIAAVSRVNNMAAIVGKDLMTDSEKCTEELKKLEHTLVHILPQIAKCVLAANSFFEEWPNEEWKPIKAKKAEVVTLKDCFEVLRENQKAFYQWKISTERLIQAKLRRDLHELTYEEMAGRIIQTELFTAENDLRTLVEAFTRNVPLVSYFEEAIGVFVKAHQTKPVQSVKK